MLDNIKETLLRELPAYLSRNGVHCKVIKCEVENVDQNQLAYHAASIIYRAKLTLEENGNVTVHDTLVKTMPHTAIMRQVMNSEIQFEDEYVMYNNVIPLLLKKVVDHTCVKDRLEWWRPQDLFLKCYYSSNGDYNHAMIVLEDLTPKGYQIRGQPVTLVMQYSDVLTAIRALARFHALSYDLKWREPEYFLKNVAGKVKDTRLFVTEPGREKWNHCIKFLHLSSLLPCSWLEKEDKCGKYKRGIEKLRNTMDDPKVLNSLLIPVEPLAVLCHGDYVMNNMLFKDDEVKLIDFQIAMYSSPFVDLATIFFMHGGEFINRWDELLEEYHNCLTRCLGRKPKELSLDAFREDFIRCGLFGYMISVSFLISLGETPTDKTFEERMKELPDDFELRSKHILKHVRMENEDTARRVVPLLREVIERGMV